MGDFSVVGDAQKRRDQWKAWVVTKPFMSKRAKMVTRALDDALNLASISKDAVNLVDEIRRAKADPAYTRNIRSRARIAEKIAEAEDVLHPEKALGKKLDDLNDAIVENGYKYTSAQESQLNKLKREFKRMDASLKSSIAENFKELQETFSKSTLLKEEKAEYELRPTTPQTQAAATQAAMQRHMGGMPAGGAPAYMSGIPGGGMTGGGMGGFGGMPGMGGGMPGMMPMMPLMPAPMPAPMWNPAMMGAAPWVHPMMQMMSGMMPAPFVFLNPDGTGYLGTALAPQQEVRRNADGSIYIGPVQNNAGATKSSSATASGKFWSDLLKQAAAADDFKKFIDTPKGAELLKRTRDELWNVMPSKGDLNREAVETLWKEYVQNAGAGGIPQDTDALKAMVQNADSAFMKRLAVPENYFKALGVDKKVLENFYTSEFLKGDFKKPVPKNEFSAFFKDAKSIEELKKAYAAPGMGYAGVSTETSEQAKARNTAFELAAALWKVSDADDRAKLADQKDQTVLLSDVLANGGNSQVIDLTNGAAGVDSPFPAWDAPFEADAVNATLKAHVEAGRIKPDLTDSETAVKSLAKARLMHLSGTLTAAELNLQNYGLDAAQLKNFEGAGADAAAREAAAQMLRQTDSDEASALFKAFAEQELSGEKLQSAIDTALGRGLRKVELVYQNAAAAAAAAAADTAARARENVPEHVRNARNVRNVRIDNDTQSVITRAATAAAAADDATSATVATAILNASPSQGFAAVSNPEAFAKLIKDAPAAAAAAAAPGAALGAGGGGGGVTYV